MDGSKEVPSQLVKELRETAHTLRVSWERGGMNTVDVSSIINNFRVYAPLRRSATLFRRVRVGEHGTDIVWTDELDMSADTLWRLAQEQTGKTMSADDFRLWHTRKQFTLDDAAGALGISRRMAAYYDHGDKPIPRVVALATQAV